MEARSRELMRIPAAEVAKFTAMTALLAIFFDAALGHGLTWENDPYWTYWVTKTFLISTVFGLSVAWFGLGVGRGAIYTVVHTLILTIYYWTFSPVGFPSHPVWLDFEHTWATGIPIHFGVIYLGYLTALWIWRRQPALIPISSGHVALRALVVGLVIVVVSGGIASAALGSFPGFTWFLVRLLITVPFLYGWFSFVGLDLVAAVSGGLVLAFIWATYSQFLGPSGLPHLPLRIFDPSSPDPTAHWLDYFQLYIVSLPIFVATMIIILGINSRLSVPVHESYERNH